VVEVPEQVKQLESQDKQEFPERNLLDEQLRQLVLALSYFWNIKIYKLLITSTASETRRTAKETRAIRQIVSITTT
jgi:hypothetical protein